MSYTITCIDPECKTVFELDPGEFDAIYEAEYTISCPTCGQEFEWDYDPDKADGEEITLTAVAEVEPEGDEIEEGDEDDIESDDEPGEDGAAEV